MYDDLITNARELCEKAKAEKAKGNFIDCAALSWAIVKNIVPQLCDALVAMTARAEKAEAENRWIPVGERLPKTEKPVQVYMPKLYMSVQTGFYTKYYGEDDGEWYEHWVASGDVTHWRPLPEPPKGE